MIFFLWITHLQLSGGLLFSYIYSLNTLWLKSWLILGYPGHNYYFLMCKFFFFLWSNAWKEPTYKRKSLLRLTTWRDNLPWLVAGAKNVQVGLCYNTSRPAPTNLFSLVSSRGSTSSKIAPPSMANYSNTWAHGKHFTFKSQLSMYDKCCGFLTVHLKEIQRFLCNLVGQFSTITSGNEY